MRTPIEALKYLEDRISVHPMCNLEIVDDIMRGDFSSAVNVGGDEADISEWCAVCRAALSGHENTESAPRS